MTIAKRQKSSEKIKQLLSNDIPIDELGDIFNFVTRKIVETLNDENCNSEEAKNYSDQMKETGTLFVKSLSDLPAFSNKKTFSIRIQPKEYLQLRKMYKNSANRSWHFLSRNEEKISESLGRDTEETRKAIEERFNIKFEDVSPFLPPPLQ